MKGSPSLCFTTNKRVSGDWDTILKKIRLGGKGLTDDEYTFLVSRFQPLDSTLPLIKCGHTTVCSRVVTVDEINERCRGDDQPDAVWHALTTDGANFDLTNKVLLDTVCL